MLSRLRATTEASAKRDEIFRWLRQNYFTVDGRSLALCRVGIGIILLVDLFRRVRWIRDLYSNEGLLPNHTVLWRPFQAHAFSFFFMASTEGEATIGFVVAFLAFFCLLVGYRTRLAHVASFLLTTSLHSRILIAENGGSVALGALVFWTLFLPLGRRFSIDAVVADLRRRPHETPADLRGAARPAPDTRPTVSLAVFAVSMQLAVVYIFNFLHKSGNTWKTGTAVYYVLQQERIVTTLGLWVRHHLPFAVMVPLTYGTLAIEAAAPFLLLSPFFRTWTRALAALSLTALHGGIALMVNLGIFSAAMLGFYPLLLESAHWEFLAQRTRGKPRIVFYDAGCGICFQIVRVLARLDSRHRLAWIPNDGAEAIDWAISQDLAERTMVVVDPADGTRWTRAEALGRIVSALPFAGPLGGLLRLPGIREGLGLAYDAFARRRTAISSAFGLRACALPPRGGNTAVETDPNAATEDGDVPLSTPWRRLQSRLALGARESGVALAIVVAAADCSVSNRVIPRALRWESRPQWMADAVMYTHVAEGWSLFAPEAPIYDEMIVVDATTEDGRHVDPYNEIGSRVHTLPVDDIPERLGHDSFFCDYTLRIPGNGAYFTALSEWIRRYPERTGNSRDALTSFEVIKLEHTPPAPGQTRATNIRRTVLLKWPEATR